MKLQLVLRKMLWCSIKIDLCFVAWINCRHDLPHGTQHEKVYKIRTLWIHLKYEEKLGIIMTSQGTNHKPMDHIYKSNNHV